MNFFAGVMKVPPKRKFVGVKFECCGVYRQIYMNKEGTAYEGYCPLCHKKVKIKVDPDKGVNCRFFNAR